MYDDRSDFTQCKGTPVILHGEVSPDGQGVARRPPDGQNVRRRVDEAVHDYLAHKKLHPPRTLLQPMPRVLGGT